MKETEIGDHVARAQEFQTDIKLVRDVMPRIERIERQLQEIIAEGKRLDQDLGVLLYYALYDLNLRTIRDLLAVAPPLTPFYEQKTITHAWLDEQRTMAEEFVAQTEKALQYTMRHDRLLSVVQNAENEADNEVRQVPQDKRPSDVDPFDLRSYAIAIKKCKRVLSFLRREEAEMNEQTAVQRAAMQERYGFRAQ